jgi:hypothetical protein
MRKVWVFRYNAVPIVLGLFLITFGVAIFGSFTNWHWMLNSYAIWLMFGGVALAIGLGLSGFDALLKEATPPFVTATGVMPQGDWGPMDVVVHDYPVSPEVVQRYAPGEKPVATALVGRDRQGRKVPTQVVPLGGRNAFGIHISSGGLGFLILRGNQVMAMGDAYRGEFYFSPRVFRTIDISEVEEECVQVMRRHVKFEYGVTPIYELGSYAKGFIEFIWANSESIQEMLTDPSKVVSPIGEADDIFYQGRYHSQLSENATLRYERRHYLDTIQSQSEGMAGRARRDSSVYRGAEPEEPTWVEATRKPQGDTER